jgi:thioredoxin-dependent adenylylsulfate APS reductase
VASAPTPGRVVPDGHSPLGDTPFPAFPGVAHLDSTEGRPTTVPGAHAATGDLEDHGAEAVLAAVFARFPPHRMPVVTSLAPEGMVILDMLTRLGAQPRVLTLDTGHLHRETLQLIDTVQRRFAVEVEILRPDVVEVDTMVRERGERPFYASVESRLLCCEVRKVQPLRRAMRGLDGWITGLRRDQTSSRRRTPKLGRDLANGMIWKVAPLADWTTERVWGHIRARDLPYNPLHDEGYASIGCDPCTRAIGPDEPERAGRWWWEHPETSSECGLHLPVASPD